MKNKKLRLSYTLLNLWRAGRIDDAIIYYFKLGGMTNKYMEEGKKWDEYVNKHVMEKGYLPEEFGGDKLIKPRTQEKWEAEYGDYEIVGVPDIVDETTLYEIKTGGKDSGSYSIDFQVSMYLLLAELKKINIEKAYILHYDQVSNTKDRSLIWNSREEVDRAKNWIETIAPEIMAYFTDNDLFNKQLTQGSI